MYPFFAWCTPKILNIPSLPFLSQANLATSPPNLHDRSTPPPPNHPTPKWHSNTTYEPPNTSSTLHQTHHCTTTHHCHTLHCDPWTITLHHPNIVPDWMLCNTFGLQITQSIIHLCASWITQSRVMIPITASISRWPHFLTHSMSMCVSLLLPSFLSPCIKLLLSSHTTPPLGSNSLPPWEGALQWRE